jgi:hypothetical protein
MAYDQALRDQQTAEFLEELKAYKRAHPNWPVLGFFEVGTYHVEVGILTIGNYPDLEDTPADATPEQLFALGGWATTLCTLIKEGDDRFSLTSYQDQMLIGSCEGLENINEIY